MQKKSTLILIIICLVVTLSACKKTEYGEVKDPVNIETSEDIEDEDMTEGQFNSTDCNLGYKFKYVDVGRAHLRIPYPSTWTVTVTSPYKIQFTAPEDDKYFPGQSIYFWSSLQTADMQDDMALLDPFTKCVLNDTYTVSGGTYKQQLSIQISEMVTNSKISDAADNYHIEYKYDNVNVKRISSGKKTESLYMQKQAFYWGWMPCLLSGMTTQDNKDNLCNLLEYMMSNCRYINNTINSTTMEETGHITIPVCPVYEKSSAEPGKYFDEAYSFVCPLKNVTGFAQSVISVYETSKKNWTGLATDEQFNRYKNTFLRNAYGSDYSKLSFSGYVMPDKGSVQMGDKKVSEYIYTYAVNSVDQINMSQGYFVGQEWLMVCYPVKVGDKVDVIVLTTTRDGLVWTMDCVEKIAQKIKYQ